MPRFYLKLFSPSAEGKSINIYNINRANVIVNGNLEKQCYQDYFYGKEPKIEKALGVLEGECSQIFRDITETLSLPSNPSKAFLDILRYMVVQYFRTVYAAEELNEFVEKFVKHLMTKDLGAKQLSLTEEQMSSIKININEPSLLALTTSYLSYWLLIDLEAKLLRISSEHEFVTSDHPVVFYNQLMSFRRDGSNVGLAAKGLQIFFPVNPKLMVMLYDGSVYGVGLRHSRVLDLNSKDDIEQLNRLQYVSARENIYFRNKDSDIIKSFDAAQHFRRSRKARTETIAMAQGETPMGRRELIMSSREDINTRLTLSFVRLLKKAKLWQKEFQNSTAQPVLVPRNRMLVEDHREFLQLVDSGKYRPSDFLKFVNQKHGSS